MSVIFGLGKRKSLSGAELYVRVFQLCSLLPLPFMLVLSSEAGIMTSDNALTFLADLGYASIPRAEAMLLSLIYRRTYNEILVYFILIAAALAWGLVAKKILGFEGSGGMTARKILFILILCDLAARIIPMRASVIFGTVPSVIGALIRLVCLALVAADIRAAKKEVMEEEK